MLFRSVSQSRYAGEKKFFDTIINSAVDTTAENITSLNLIPQGVTESTRVGRKCTITNIHCKGFILWSSASSFTTLAASRIRVVLVQDTQCNGANAAYTDVYASTTTVAWRNMSNSTRFKVLKEWIITPPNMAATTSDNWATSANTIGFCSPTKLKFNMRCSIPVEVSSTTGAITEIRSNNLTVMAVSDSGDDIHTLYLNCRVRYTDK